MHRFYPFLVMFTAGCLVVSAPPLVAANSDEDLQRLLRRPGGGRPEIVAQFDGDNDGVLNKEERVAARLHLHRLAEKSALEAFQRMDKDGDGRVGGDEQESGRNNPLREADANGDGFVDRNEAAGVAYRSERGTAALDAFRSHPDAGRLAPRNFRNAGSGLYDLGTVRTFFLEFEDDDWLAEMHDFYHSDVNVPATLVVDGESYEDIGVGYRGNSSFFLMAPDKKRSLNLVMDHAKKGGDLYGYKTLNLHNGAEDPTFVREVLYLRVCRDYIPAFHANFVKLVINGESWGIYLNVQQYNNDFLNDWFGSKKGVRWKASGGPGKKGLSYEGEDPAAYAGYALKTGDAPESALSDLINLTRVLGETPDAGLETALSPIFNIDGALWSLALENVFVDEGYVIRISDYNLFQDKNGRFHLLQHDGNEVFNVPHGPGLPRGFDATKLDPFHNIENRDYAVIHRLLKIPHLRARYVAHVRTILDEWFRWDRLEPEIAGYRALIADEVLRDVRKLYSNEDFEKGVLETVANGGALGIKEFVERRREFLLGHEALKTLPPAIQEVEVMSSGSGPVRVTARVTAADPLHSVWVHWASKRNEPYAAVEMFDDGATGDGEAGDGVFGGEIPAQARGTRFQYYVEARSGAESITSAFHPEKAEAAALTHLVRR
ncbi:MAG TPA: hypothetical protein DCY13_23005 [Verrucomicrobiales bacterium]|nr:hypothetical protein [Verrucomicrobiales bacterium]